MIVERVARAMTEGAPRAGFTARVMAPIHGRPQPGFTSRVMAGLDAPRPRAGIVGLRPVLLAAGALAIAVGAAVWLPGGLALPPAPDAPRIAARPYDRELIGIPPLPYNRWAPELPAPVTRRPRAAVSADASAGVVAPASQAGTPTLHTLNRIAPLTPPREITLPSLEPPAALIAALEGPAPLAGPAPLTLAALKLEKEIP